MYFNFSCRSDINGQRWTSTESHRKKQTQTYNADRERDRDRHLLTEMDGGRQRLTDNEICYFDNVIQLIKMYQTSIQ